MSDNSAPKLYCSLCDYTARYPKDLTKHFNTRKHKMVCGVINNDTKPAPLKKHICKNCGIEYKYASGLSRHKAKCDQQHSKVKELETQLAEKDMQLKSKSDANIELLSAVKEMVQAAKDGKFQGNTTNNTTNNNTTNNQFNLNIFLNEKCKDAMNIEDFVNQIKLQLSDLETQGSMGYVEGISNIFIKNLDEMDEDKRPIHCTDTKRETLYVKNNDTWEKGETGREQMKKAIDTISKNNIKQFGQWINENPQCKVPHTPKADQFHQISSEVAGSAKEKNVDKIIRKIAKGTTIDKN